MPAEVLTSLALTNRLHELMELKFTGSLEERIRAAEMLKQVEEEIKNIRIPAAWGSLWCDTRQHGRSRQPRSSWRTGRRILRSPSRSPPQRPPPRRRSRDAAPCPRHRSCVIFCTPFALTLANRVAAALSRVPRAAAPGRTQTHQDQPRHEPRTIVM
jgi:hypothetical protein